MKKTPMGVIILSLLATFAGIMNLLWGIRMMGIVTFGPVESGNGVFLSGLLTFVVGLIWLSVGGALFAMKSWSLMFCQIIAIFGLINAAFILFGTGSLASGIGAAFIPAIVFWYCSRQDIQQEFSVEGRR
ncbi:MAG: hypothetical protein U0869_16645 [Chloroflexota bacterium]